MPEIDALNVWPLISGQNNTSPRVSFPVTTQSYMKNNYKLIVGDSIPYASWAGDIYPNETSAANGATPMQDVTANCSNGCLFDVEMNDMTEHIDIANEYPNIVSEMKSEFESAKTSFYTNNDTANNACPSNVTIECACWMAKYYWNGFFGPYQNFDIE